MELYYNPVCPFSRQASIYLQELDIDFIRIREDYWLRSEKLLSMNPACSLPILVINEHLIIKGIYPILEYLHDTYDQFAYFMGSTHEIKAETRRVIAWFNDKFYLEVSKVLINEKFIRLVRHLGEPRTQFLKAAKANLKCHMNYMGQLLHQDNFFISEHISCADIAAATHLSILDYFSEIAWEHWPDIRHWYSLLKSRPSFQPVLHDRISGFVPPQYYNNLDF